MISADTGTYDNEPQQEQECAVTIARFIIEYGGVLKALGGLRDLKTFLHRYGGDAPMEPV